MSWDGYWELQCREIITKKDRACEWCAELIPKGSKCQYRVYVFDGFAAAYMHLECFKAMKDSPYWSLDQGWHFGEFERGKTSVDSFEDIT